MIETTVNKSYSKLYISNKKDNQQLCFKVDFDLVILHESDKKVNFTMNAYVSYLFIIEDNKCFVLPKKTNHWEIATYNKNSCGFKNSIMIEDNFRSYGIGSFLLNTILSIANNYIPDYSLSAGLSLGDAREDNKERRNSLYRNIGFEFVQSEVSGGENSTVLEDGIYIDKLSNLNLNREFDYIEEIDTLKLANLYTEASNRVNELQEENKGLNKSNISYKAYNEKLLKSLGKWQISVFSIALIVVLIAAIFLRFIFG